jgi:hypothetical protein
MQKNSRFWLCRECAVEWGCYKAAYREWPEWVRELVKEAQRLRKRDERATMREELRTPLEIERIIEKKGEILQ